MTQTPFKPVGNMPEHRQPDGDWPTFQHWVNYATRDIGGENAACYDSQGRLCRIGGDFMKADVDGAFPVYYWYGLGGQTAAEWQAAYNAKPQTPAEERIREYVQYIKSLAEEMMTGKTSYLNAIIMHSDKVLSILTQSQPSNSDVASEVRWIRLIKDVNGHCKVIVEYRDGSAVVVINDNHDVIDHSVNMSFITPSPGGSNQKGLD